MLLGVAVEALAGLELFSEGAELCPPRSAKKSNVLLELAAGGVGSSRLAGAPLTLGFTGSGGGPRSGNPDIKDSDFLVLLLAGVERPRRSTDEGEESEDADLVSGVVTGVEEESLLSKSGLLT